MKTVVFIHGMFMTPRCWDGWAARFAARGWRAMAPAWPHHDGAPAELRAKHPDAALGKLGLEEVVATYEAALAGVEEPYLVGHSMGGLVVQLLLGRGRGKAGAAVHSAPPKGVLSLAWSFLKSNWPAISPFVDKAQPVMLTPEQFHYAFANALSDEDSRKAYETYAVPESRRVGNAPTTAFARIDFAAARPPLLMVAGGEDHIIPASLNRTNFARYEPSAGKTELRVFDGRCHYTLAQPGWEEVADFVADWLERQ